MFTILGHLVQSAFGDRSFASAAPTLWNKLPSNIKVAKTVNQFKTLLKSWLFDSLYSSR
jgi:hypothetical protein